MVFIYLLMALFGIAAVIFAMQNPDPIALTFLRWKTLSMPLSFALLLSAFIGVVVASVSAFAEKIQLQRRIRDLERQIADLAEHTWLPSALREPQPLRERLTSAPRDVADRAVVESAAVRTAVTHTEARPPL